jgi:glycosyltransferase involved in cell wall biosynthesis
MGSADADCASPETLVGELGAESAARLQARTAPAIRVLILSRHPDQQGGVVNYLQLLKRRLHPAIAADLFIIGSRPGETGALRAARRLATDLLRFAAAVARGGYDVVHMNPTLDPQSTLREAGFLLALKLLGHRRAVIFFRGWDVALERRIARNPLYRALFRWLFGGAAQILVLSPSFAGALRGLGCRAPIDVATTMFEGETLRQALGEPAAQAPRRTILYLSRFVREKGVYELIDAFAALAPSYPELTLIMAGDGPEAAGMKEAARARGLGDRIHFPGYLRGLDKARAFAQAKVFVLATSYKEGLPNALLEALAAGNVVVTTRVAGIPEVIEDGENGVLIGEVTAGTVEGALRQILADEAYCTAVRARNMEKAWVRYEADVVTRRIEAVYARVAGRTA